MANDKSSSSKSSSSSTTTTTKKPETKKVEKKADPVVEAAVAVVESNGKPGTVVDLAKALNKAKKPKVNYNPFGAIPATAGEEEVNAV